MFSKVGEKLYYSQLYGCHRGGGGGKMFDVGHGTLDPGGGGQ